MNLFLDVALRLAERFRFHISPPIPRDKSKHPRERWKTYQTTQAPTHLIRYWGINYPDHNYGIITGEIPNLVVLEADDANADNIIRNKCPKTPLVLHSGSRRGYHYYYRYPHGQYVRTRGGIPYQGEPTKIDIRGHGGLVVGPGSIHHSGNDYRTVGEWLTVDPDDIPTFDPRWLGLDATPPRQRVYDDVPYECDIDLDVRQELARDFLTSRPGSREGDNASGYAFALAMELIHGFHLSPEEALPVFLEWGTKKSNTYASGGYRPWTEGELYHKLRSAACRDDAEGRPDGYRLPIDSDSLDLSFDY